MRRALSLTLWGITLLVLAVADLHGGERAAGGQPSGNLSPVTLKVIAPGSGGKFVSEFKYQYSIRTLGGKGDFVQEEWRTHTSAQGPLKVQAPASCQLHIAVKTRLLGVNYNVIDITSANRHREFTFRFPETVTVSGIVRDARTKLPVKGAAVMPLISWCAGPDKERAVLTDDKGAFVLPGVDPYQEAEIRHPDYMNTKVKTFSPGELEGLELLLERGETFEGKVTTEEREPLPGVRVCDETGKQAVTGKNGVFVLRSGLKMGLGRYRLCFDKPGYIPQTVDRSRKEFKESAVVLEPLYELRGRVVTPDGKPIASLVAMAGEGRIPPGYECSQAELGKGEDSFLLHLKSPGTHWVGVRADGYTVWEGLAQVTRKGVTLNVKLEPGVTVTGQVKLPPGNLGPVQATLTPHRSEASVAARDLGILHTPVTADGTFTFPHVQPNGYVLTISGKKVTERSWPLQVNAAGADAGVVEVEGTGRIVGQVFRPGGGTWAFGQGEIHRIMQFEFATYRGNEFGTWDHPIASESIHFRADEDGRFEVDNVPAGNIRIFVSGVHFLIRGQVRDVLVTPGQTTEVRFFDPQEIDQPDTWSSTLTLCVIAAVALAVAVATVAYRRSRRRVRCGDERLTGRVK
jgi:hypothetical protein